MIQFCIIICFVILGVSALLALYRFLAGPTILDRIISFDMLAICIVGMIILFSILQNSPLYIEIMLIFSLLGFVGTVAFVSFMQANPHRFRLLGSKAENSMDSKK